MCDLTDEKWLATQPPKYQRSVWSGRAFARKVFAELADNPEEAREHHRVAAEFERNAYEATRGPMDPPLSNPNLTIYDPENFLHIRVIKEK